MAALVVIIPLVKVSVPSSMMAEPKVIPPFPFRVKFLILRLNKPAGRLNDEALAKTRVALALLALIVPEVLTTEFPEIVNVRAFSVKAPNSKLKVPVTLTLVAGGMELILTPNELAMVNPLKVSVSALPEIRIVCGACELLKITVFPFGVNVVPLTLIQLPPR